MLKELQQRRVMVLVTSRIALGANLGSALQLRIAALPSEMNQQLLIALTGDAVGLRPSNAEKLVDICGGNALAISILAGLLQGQYCTPEVHAAHPYIASV